LASLNNAEEIKVIDSVQKRIGFASRTDAVNPRGRTVEEVAKELELTEEEKRILAKFLPNFDNVEDYQFHPSITPEQKRKIIDSIRIRVDDGIPYITIDGNPFLIDEIPDKRDWSTVLAPSDEQIKTVSDLLLELGRKAGFSTFERPNNMGFTLEEEDRAREHIKLNIVAFSQWAMDLYREIGNKYPVLDDDTLERTNFPDVPGGMIHYTGMGLYFNALSGLLQNGILDYYGEDDFLNAHDLWGHIATGRSFDRHGEWANALAMWSMMDRWAKENNIPESDVIRMKLRWMTGLEFDRFSFRNFVDYPDGITDDEKRELQTSVYRVLNSGMATDDEIKEVLALLDHGRVAQSENAKKLTDATEGEKAEIVKTDVVRTTLLDRTKKRLGFASASNTRRIVDMDLGDSGSETGEVIAEKMGLTGKAARIAKEAFQRTLESISDGTFRKYKMAKGVDEHKSRLLDSIRIVISKDDVPMIMADPHPVFFRLLTDRRDWSKIEIPSNATINEFVKRLKEGNNPLYRRGIQQRTDENTGYQKFNKWAFEKLLPLINATERQEYGERTNPGELDLDDELMVLSGNESWASLYIGSLFDGESAIGNSLIEAFDALHEAVGHVAIGRGFDRHGEYANALAVLSLFRQPELQELLTKGEIQELLGKIMADYLAGPIGLATREQSNVLEDALNAVNHDIKMSPTGELMQLITDYEGDLFELIDLLESEIDKTPALKEDGSPLESRPSGFASQSRRSIDRVKPEVRDEIAIADAVHLSPNKKTSKPAGFASRAVDFKQGTHNIEVIDNAPEADVFNADESGRIIQVYVPEGVEVTNPRTGKKMILDSPEASVEFVADGGELSKVPDSHAIEAILSNTEDIPGTVRDGWRFLKPGARFNWEGGGGGAHGMMRIKDKKTNALLGIKFEASFSEGDGFDGEEPPATPYPISRWGSSQAPKEIINEVVAQAIIQALGFEPGPVRIVKRSPFGSGMMGTDRRGDPLPITTGPAMIVDFAQNRYPDVRDSNDYVRRTVRKESALRTLFLDSVLANGDRNSSNFLTSRQSDGTRVIIPIDHGQIMEQGRNYWDIETALTRNIRDNTVGFESILYEGWTPGQLKTMIPEIMADYRVDMDKKKNDIIKSMNEAIDKLESIQDSDSIRDSDFILDLRRSFEDSIKRVFSRLDELALMSDEEVFQMLKYLSIGRN
jgi:hypothetical protein